MAGRAVGQPAAVSALELGRSDGSGSSSSLQPLPGAYLGSAQGETRHRVSFSLGDGRVRNVRVDGHLVAPEAPVAGGRVQIRHLGFAMEAEWRDAAHVAGQVRMRGKWARNQVFRFEARRRVGDVLG